MIPLDRNTKTLIDKQKPLEQLQLTDSDDGVKIGMNFEQGMIVIELDTDSQGNTSMLTVPIRTGHIMALKMLEACAIINFANSIGLKLEQTNE